MDMVPQNKLKTGSESPLITEFRDFKNFNHSSFVHRNVFIWWDLPSIRELAAHAWQRFLVRISPHWQVFTLISDLTASSFPSCWKPFISFPSTLLGKKEFCQQREQFSRLLFILPVNTNKQRELQELSYLQTPQGVSQKSIWPKTIKYKFTWYKHRMTVEISPRMSALHNVHTNYSGNCTNYQSHWINLKVKRICRKKKANEMHL